MKKPKVDWVKIKQECDLFDLSEYCPEMRQESGVFQNVPVKDLADSEDWYIVE